MTVPVETLQYIETIREINMLRYLSGEELEKFLALAEIVDYKKGEKIINLGDVSPYLYGVVKGGMHVSMREANDQEVFICTMEQGEGFGESAIFMTEKRTADVTSSQDSVLLRVHRKDLMTFIRDNPQAGNKILMLIISSLLSKLREANQELAFEKQSVIELDDIDSLVKDFMEASD
jgi:CRP-like cAMP-binding protein